jgi:hypothetical protein
VGRTLGTRGTAFGAKIELVMENAILPELTGRFKR